VPLGFIVPPEDIENYDQPMNQQEFLSENIDAELDDDNDVDINDTTNGMLGEHHQLGEMMERNAIEEGMGSE